MGFRINLNSASLAAQRHLTRAQRDVDHSLKALSSGSRIVNAGDDAAGFAISEGLRGQISGLKQAKFNAENALSLVQTAEGGLNEQNNILIRLRELAVYSASDTVSDTEREFLDFEFQQLVAENDRISKTTRFGTKQLLTGSGEQFEFQIGAYGGEENIVRFTLNADTSSDNLGVAGVSVEDQDEARDALEDIDEALTKIAGARATFGAIQSRFQYAIDNTAIQEENLANARSQIVDADVAEETARLVRGRIMQDMGIAVLSQANQAPLSTLKLLG